MEKGSVNRGILSDGAKISTGRRGGGGTTAKKRRVTKRNWRGDSPPFGEVAEGQKFREKENRGSKGEKTHKREGGGMGTERGGRKN